MRVRSSTTTAAVYKLSVRAARGMTSRRGQQKRETLCERMAGWLKALGLDGKTEYTEKIPETLAEGDFRIHEVSDRAREKRETEGDVSVAKLSCLMWRITQIKPLCQCVYMRVLNEAGHTFTRITANRT